MSDDQKFSKQNEPDSANLMRRESDKLMAETMQSIRQMTENVRTAVDGMLDIIKQSNQIRLREIRDRQARTVLWFFAIVVMPLIYLATTWNAIQSVSSASEDGDYVAIVRVNGMIAANREANALRINGALARAFGDKEAKGVMILINSPGGSPVQSAEIHDNLIRLQKENPDTPVVAFGMDSMTSGAYMVATGAPKIYANDSTITGSIGVISSSFGFSDFIRKHGIERRILTAGENKHRMDAFEPLKPADVKKYKALMNEIHRHFIAKVKETREDRLKGDEAVLFSGDVWTGKEALKLGLIDGVMNFSEVLDKEFGVKRYKDYTVPESYFSRIFSRFGAVFSDVFGLESGIMAMPAGEY